MVTVKMLKTAKGASEGHTVRTYEQGEVYDVSETLANDFVTDGVAERAGEKAIEAAPQNKAVKANRNKAVKVSKNKAA